MDEKPPDVVLGERIRERYGIVSKDRCLLHIFVLDIEVPIVRENMISLRSKETAMQQIARTRSRVWFSIVFKKVPDRGSQIQQVAVFHWRQRTTEHAG